MKGRLKGAIAAAVLVTCCATAAIMTASAAPQGTQATPPTTTHSAWFKYAPWNSNLPEVQKTGTGLEYVVIASGPATGAAPQANDAVRVYYEGRLNKGGRSFDSSFERGAPDVYMPNELVKGLREALTMMKPGDRWIIYIPTELAYAERGFPGLIGPDENLIFEILMVGVD